MITYELATKLRNAGYPFGEKVIIDSITIPSDLIAFEDGTYVLPTLSGLIKACGDGFEQLDRNKTVGGKVEYTTDSIYGERKWFKTPEIAVAKLWLTLHKKDSTCCKDGCVKCDARKLNKKDT